MFTDERRKMLATHLRYVNSGCAFAIDILPNLDVISCMLLKHIRTRFENGLKKTYEFSKLNNNIDAQKGVYRLPPFFIKYVPGSV
jgi:hypothetical protein